MEQPGLLSTLTGGKILFFLFFLFLFFFWHVAASAVLENSNSV